MPAQVRILHLPPVSAVESVEAEGPLTLAYARQGLFGTVRPGPAVGGSEWRSERNTEGSSRLLVRRPRLTLERVALRLRPCACALDVVPETRTGRRLQNSGSSLARGWGRLSLVGAVNQVQALAVEASHPMKVFAPAASCHGVASPPM